MPRKHNGEALNPAPIGEVLEVLRSNVRSNFLLQKEVPHYKEVDLNPDVRYLTNRGGYSDGFVLWALVEFGEPVVVEAMRRIHGLNKPAAYLAAVCRNVLGGESTATGVSATQLPRPHVATDSSEIRRWFVQAVDATHGFDYDGLPKLDESPEHEPVAVPTTVS